MTTLALTQNEHADRLLSESPLALLIGLVLDQQITLEKAFIAPYLLQERLEEPLDASRIAEMEPSELEKIFSIKPALHRFPASMAKRVQEICTIVANQYDNDASQIWNLAQDGQDLKKRINKLPGFGEMKTKIFIALLGKQLGVSVKGWQEAAKPFGDPNTFMSIADITDAESLSRVRQYKAAMKAKSKPDHG